MGRRSRKRRATAPEQLTGADGVARSGAPEPARSAVAEPAPRATGRPAPAHRAHSAAARRPRRGEPPRPPWHPFPLAELCILAALITGVVGFVVWGSRGHLLVAGAMILASAATLEFTLREHLTGYRSHSTLLGGVVAVASAAALFAAGVARPAVAALAAALFLGGMVAFRGVVKRRSGRLAWRGA